MDRWRGRVALVTGASVGIGAAIAKSLVQHGMKVVGCARNVEQIKKLAAECVSSGYSGALFPYKCDLSVEDEVLSMFSWIKAQHKGVDVCINNAGLALPDPLLSGKTSGWRTMMDVNVMALAVCTREAYQSMKEKKVDDGHIININRYLINISAIILYIFKRVSKRYHQMCFGVCGHRVLNHPDAHFYTATKYAVTALTEGLRQELREAKTHIRATGISPGIVKTEFAYRLFSDDQEKATAMYNSVECLQADDITNAVVYVLSAPPHVQIGDIELTPVDQSM